MGASCFSKPLTFVRQRSSVIVHPENQKNNENGHPSSPVQLELTQTQYLPPPILQIDPGPDGVYEDQVKSSALNQYTARLVVVSPSTAETSTVITNSRVSTPRSPVQTITKKVSGFFSNAKLTDDAEKSGRRPSNSKGKPDLNRNGSKVSLMRRRSHTSLGKRINIGGRPRTPSAVSDTSSMLCLSDGLAGLYALASLTAYETKLVPLIWQSCLEQNEYYCEHVLSRLFIRHPELEEMFNKPTPMPLAKGQKSISGCKMMEKRELIQEKSEHVLSFLNRLIMIHELDYDGLLAECERLGRSHAVYYYERGLQPYHWDAFAIGVVQEYKKTNMNVDIGTDEKELQQLAWTHFTTAVVSAIKESFEDELHRTTPGQFGAYFGDTGSNAGDGNTFRF